MPRILYKLPSRSRPEKFFETVESIIRLSSTKDYIVLASLDIDDPTMNCPETRAKLSMYPEVHAVWGSSENKIHAINRDTNAIEDWDILVAMADDLRPDVMGFDQLFINLFTLHFPDFDGLLHVPDGIVNERIPTAPIIGRKFYDRFGYIFHPAYHSVYADNELMDVAQILGKYKYERMILIRHYHPRHSRAQWDALYRKNEADEMYRHDCEIYQNRRQHNFGL